MKISLTDAIIVAVSKLVDDSKETRQPSHYDIELEIKKAGLINADPNNHGSVMGKAKRIRAILNWAYENNYSAGEKLVIYMIDLLRGVGGFRSTSPNYIGEDAIANAVEAFRSEGIYFGTDGVISPMVIDDLPLVEQEKALKAYIKRAQKGATDSALLVGTSKDLLEAVSAHIIQVKMGTYPTTANFPTLLGQAFTLLDLATSRNQSIIGEPVQKRLERSLYETGCAINQLRNKQGTGHGHPFESSITTDESSLAIKTMGIIAEFMLSKL